MLRAWSLAIAVSSSVALAADASPASASAQPSLSDMVAQATPQPTTSRRTPIVGSSPATVPTATVTTPGSAPAALPKPVVVTPRPAAAVDTRAAAVRTEAPRDEGIQASRVVLSEVKYGFFLEGHAGYWATIRPPTLTGGRSSFSNGQEMRIDIGYDIGRYVGIALFFAYDVNHVGSDYTGYSTTGLVSGSYEALIPGISVKARFAGIRDAQGVQRSWFYVRVAGGAMFYRPKALLDKLDVAVSGGLGFEYFTKLRHFSVGLEGNFSYMVLTQTMGFSIVPNVKYTF